MSYYTESSMQAQRRRAQQRPRWIRLAEQNAMQGFVLIINHREHRAAFWRKQTHLNISYRRALKIQRADIIPTRNIR